MARSFIATSALFVALVPAALAASDPGAALTADIQKLTADRATMHAAVVADIQRVTADAQAGGTSRASLKSSIAADVKKLTSDISTNHQILQADRLQGLADLRAARVAHVKLSQLKPQVQQLEQLWQDDKTDLQQDLQAAQQAIAALEASFQK
jgi:hypothetical protein